MNKKLKHILIAITFGVILYVGLNHLDVVLGSIFGIIKVFQAVIIGAIIAFILNVPVTKFSEFLTRIFSKSKKPPKKHIIKGMSITLTVLCILAVIALVAVVLIPQLIDSVTVASEAVRTHIPTWLKMLKSYGIDSEWINNTLQQLQHIDVVNILQNSFTGVTSTLISTITSTANVAANILIAIVIAFYMLMCKEKLYSQFQKITSAYLPEKISNPIYKVGHLTNATYSDFFCGQCLEAVILGVLMFLAFSIFRLPYAGLVGVLTAVLSFVPYVGSFLSCAIVALLILITNPIQALIAVVVYLVVQFCENQFIYPRVVGGSVGLPAMWTLIAVLIGGSLLGIIGMIFFIPIVAVIYKLIAENVTIRLEKKENEKSNKNDNL